MTYAVRCPADRSFNALSRCLSAVLVALLAAASVKAATRDYSTYLGGDSNDGARGIAGDEAGFVYVVGNTGSSNFPGKTIDGSAAYLAKLDPDGAAGSCGGGLCWITTPGDGFPQAVTVTAASVYVAGWTNDPGFLPPGTPGWDTTKSSNSRDVFVLKLDRATGAVEAGTYYKGDANDDIARGVVIGPGGRVYIAGHTQSRDFPTTASAFDETVNCWRRGFCDNDLFLLVFSENLAEREYATVIGGSDVDIHRSSDPLAVDAAGRAFITAFSLSTDFPVTDGSARGGKEDAVLAVLDPQGQGASDLVWAGRIGGGAEDRGNAVALGPSGIVWVGGWTASSDFPGAGAGADGPQDGFITELAEGPAGFSIVSSVLLGGSGTDAVNGIALDAAGGVYATGSTDSADFPATPGADDASVNGRDDAFLAKLDSTGTVVHATYLGGSDDENGTNIALHEPAAGLLRARVAGATWSSDFPTTLGAFQSTFGGSPGNNDAFVASYTFGPPAVCGDGSCNAGEDPCSCPADCGAPPLNETACTDGLDDDCDGLTDCDDPDCGSDSSCASGCTPNGEPCSDSSECCSGNCSRNKCKGGGGHGAGIEVLFLRGDSNRDGVLDLSDPIATLNHLVLSGRRPACADAADDDDDGRIAVSDALHSLAHLFAGGTPLPAPYPELGSDPTADTLGCEFASGE